MKVAISACLLGRACRYDGTDNLNASLLEKLKGAELIPFCPEDHAFGTPRPPMDLIASGTPERIEAVCSKSAAILSSPIRSYAKAFFDQHSDVNLCIGKDRSPSCGVCSAKVYDASHRLISGTAAGLMAQEAMDREIPCIDAEQYAL